MSIGDVAAVLSLAPSERNMLRYKPNISLLWSERAPFGFLILYIRPRD